MAQLRGPRAVERQWVYSVEQFTPEGWAACSPKLPAARFLARARSLAIENFIDNIDFDREIKLSPPRRKLRVRTTPAARGHSDGVEVKVRLRGI